MNIWVDADACPKVIKEIIFRAADRAKVLTTFVANHAIYTPPSPFIKKIQVAAGFDVADNAIVKYMKEGDLVITADVPLASQVIEQKGVALNPRGQLYTPDNVKHHLTMRNFNEQLRSSGMSLDGPDKISQRDSHAFAAQLDKLLQKRFSPN